MGTELYFPRPIQGYFHPDNARKFTLTASFIYTDPEKDVWVGIPSGFTTDFNSIPEAVWWYLAPWEYPEAGLVHDWLYRAPTSFTSTSYKPPLSRQQCDDIHRRILDLKGCRWSKRQTVWLALRSFGGRAWSRHRADDLKVGSSQDIL